MNMLIARILSGYYTNHSKGEELLRIDVQEVIDTEIENSALADENKGLILDNSKLNDELANIKSLFDKDEKC